MELKVPLGWQIILKCKGKVLKANSGKICIHSLSGKNRMKNETKNKKFFDTFAKREIYQMKEKHWFSFSSVGGRSY